jgi:hypothetical protein
VTVNVTEFDTIVELRFGVKTFTSIESGMAISAAGI